MKTELSEVKIAASFAIKREVLRKYRQSHLQEGRDWSVEPGKPVVYTKVGFNRVTNHFRPEDGIVQLEDSTEGVVIGFPRNPSLLQLNLCGRTVLCRVKSQKKWVHGMTVDVIPLKNSGSREIYQAVREPRFRGRM